MDALLIRETLAKGGWLLPVIFLLSAAGWYLLLVKLPVLRGERLDHAAVTEEAIEAYRRGGREALFALFPPGLPRTTFRGFVREVAAAGEEGRLPVAEEILLEIRPRLFSGLGTVAVLASLAPLLGLLGTVNGMMETFDVIHLFGASNPMLLADGISEALLTTQAGLLAGFPLVLGLARIRQRSRNTLRGYRRSALHLAHRLSAQAQQLKGGDDVSAQT